MKKSQIKKKTLIVGMVLVLLAGLCFMGYRGLEDYCINLKGKYEISVITGADVCADDSYVVLVDNMETVLLLDNADQKIQWLKSKREICDGYAEIHKVFFDEQNRVYIDVLRFDENYQYVVEEVLYQYGTDGKESGRLVIPEIGTDRTQSCIRGFKCQDGLIYYYNENTKQFTGMNVETGKTEPYGNYDCEQIDQAFALGFTEDDTITLAYADGTLALGWADGSIEVLGQIDYYFDEDETGIIVNQYIYLDGMHFVTDGRYFDFIYQIVDNTLEPVLSVPTDTLLVQDYQKRILNNYGLSAMNNGNGKVLICYWDCLSYTADMTEFFEIDNVGAYALPASVLAAKWIRSILYILLYVFGIVGFVLLCGSIMNWRLSLRSKLFVIIMPITLGGIVSVTYYEMHAIEKDYKEQLYEEYDAIGAFYQNQLDKDTLYSVASLEDADKLEEMRLDLMENMKNAGTWSDSVQISVYKYFENGVHLLLYSTTTDCLYAYSAQYDFDEQHRLQDTDTYHQETNSVGRIDLDSITLLRDENGEIFGFIDVYGNLDKLKITQDKIKEKVAIISVILGLILGTLLYILAYYIIRNLRKTSRTVNEIAQGNLDARVNKITKDELGVISAGVNDMADKIEALFEEQENFSTQVIETLVGTIDAKDNYTNGHSKRVAKYSQMIAQKLGKDQKECKQIYYAGLLHDIGKIGVPDEIINKTARLDDEEYKIIKTHPEIGHRLLCNLTQIENISIGARYHHERYDGKGYPDGLAGEEIPEIARIIAVADCYDAMTSNRSYRKAMPQEKVRGEIEKGKGTQFDPLFAEKMLEIDLEIAEIIYYN